MKLEMTFVNQFYFKSSGRKTLATWRKADPDAGFYSCDFYNLLNGVRNEEWLTMDANLQEVTKFYNTAKDFEGEFEVTVSYDYNKESKEVTNVSIVKTEVIAPKPKGV